MAQSSTSRYVFMGIRFACILFMLLLVTKDYMTSGYLALIKDFGLCLVTAVVSYSTAQGRKPAKRNMQAAGLNPDRD